MVLVVKSLVGVFEVMEIGWDKQVGLMKHPFDLTWTRVFNGLKL